MAKTKTTLKNYLDVTIKPLTGKEYSNPLKISELHLVNKILQENESVTIRRGECTAAWYKATFGS